MTGRIDITCSLPAPTLAQVRAWLTRTGWVEDPGHRGKRSTVWWHVSALHPHGGREGLRLTEGAIAKMIASAAHVLTRIRGTECTPEAVYREIVGPAKVWLVTGFGRDGSQAFAVACLSEETANRIACDYVSGPENMSAYSIEEYEVLP